MNPITQICCSAEYQQIQQNLDYQLPDLVDLIIEIQQIPAPTFHEHARAKFVAQYFADVNLENIEIDPLNNVYAKWRGTTTTADPIIVSAHSDTVFPHGTNLRVKQESATLKGPGIGDNAAGVAAILTIPRIFQQVGIYSKSDIWFVANVGEEGMGDLCGMREVVEKFGHDAKYIVVEGGSLGHVIHQAIGVKRFRIATKTDGGHSWGSFGEPNAIHELSKIISDITEISLPKSPKTTYNVGVFEGGTTVNSIASSATMLLDLRSEEDESLEWLINQVKRIVNYRLTRAERMNRKLIIDMDRVGDRPAGRVSSGNPLVKLAVNALRAVDWNDIIHDSGSTDANIPLSKNIPSVCVGLTTSGNSHRLDEFIDLPPLKKGLQQLILLILAAANLPV